MSQKTLTSFYNVRKRRATDELVDLKKKIPRVEYSQDVLKSIHEESKSDFLNDITLPNKKISQPIEIHENNNCKKNEESSLEALKDEELCVQKDLKETNNKPSSTSTTENKCNGSPIIKSVPNLHKVSEVSKLKSEALKDTKLSDQKDLKVTNDKSLAASTTEKKSNGVICVTKQVRNVQKVSELSKLKSVSSARKELSLGDIRKRLANSSRLAELKSSAERISKGIKQLQDNSEKKNIDLDIQLSPNSSAKDVISPERENHALDKKRPLMSPRKVVISPIKSPSKLPAYIRHSSLATTSNLPLPHHYRFLAELFRGMETVVSLLYNRNETITFNKLKPSVQEMLKRNFTEKHVGQIRHLVPDYYCYELQKIKRQNSNSNKETYELVISPTLPNGIKVLSPAIILERRRYFYDVLLRLVKKHHSQYLKTLDPPIVIPDDKLFRWHPEFELEKLPEIECAKLPTAQHVEKFSTAQDVLAKARELFSCNNRMDRALHKIVEVKSTDVALEKNAVNDITDNKSDVSTQTNKSSKNGTPLLNPALRGLPTALLEKVKAMQAVKAREAMTRSSGEEQKYIIYSRLPDLARTLRNIFVTERKNVLALNIVLSKLDSSFKSNVSAADLQRDIKILCEETPNWIKLHDVRNVAYLKLDRNADLKTVLSKLEALIEKYKSD